MIIAKVVTTHSGICKLSLDDLLDEGICLRVNT